MRDKAKMFRIGKIIMAVFCSVLIAELFLQMICMLWITLVPDKLANFFEHFRIWRPFITDMYSFGKATAELCASMLSYAFAVYFTKVSYDIFDSLEKTDTLPASSLKKMGIAVLISAIVIPYVKNIAFSVFVNAGYVRDGFNVGLVVLGVVILVLSSVVTRKEN